MKDRFRRLSDDVVGFAAVISQTLMDDDEGLKRQITGAYDNVKDLIVRLQQ